jgi:hypothetical protein
MILQGGLLISRIEGNMGRKEEFFVVMATQWDVVVEVQTPSTDR